MVKSFPIEFNRSKQLDKGYLIVKKAVGNINYHYHDFYELEFVVSGSATVIVNGNEMTLTRGGAYLLRPTDIHEFSANTKTEIYSVHFLPHFIDEKTFSAFISKNGYLTASFNSVDCAIMQNLLEKLESISYNRLADNTASLIISLMVSLLLGIGKTALDTVEDKSVFKAIKYLAENFTLSPTLTETAKIAGLTKTYFCRKFKSVTGKTYVEFLSSLKVDFASRLITGTKTSLTEICFLSGFNSVSQFIREFKKLKGCAPSAFRQKTAL